MTNPHIRVPDELDRPAIDACFERCSRESRYGRFLAIEPRFPSRYLGQILAPAAGSHSLVAVVHEQIVGMVNVYDMGEGACEIGVLVEDAWQHCGVGSHLVRSALALATARGVHTVIALVSATNGAALAAMGQIPGEMRTVHEGSTVEVRIELRRNRSSGVDQPARVRPPGAAATSSL
jgi:GNAT superfamily N-acetyltransferase